VANVPQLRAVIVDANASGSSPFWVTSPSSVGQDQPALTGSGQTTFLAWRDGAAPGDANGEELELLPLTWNGTSLDGGAVPLGDPMPLPRWSTHQVGDQRLPALTMSTFSGPALVSAWVDLGRDFTSAEANGDIAFQIAPLPITRNGTTPPPEPPQTLWSRLFGDPTGWTQTDTVVVTPDGNVVATYDLYAPVPDFGCGPLDAYAASAIVKFAATDGHCIWSTGLEMAHLQDWTTAHALAVDEAGDLYVSGRFGGTVNVAGGLTSAGASDVFLMKLAGSDGTVQWANRYGGANSAELGWNGLDVRNGVVALAGDFYTAANFGGADLTAPSGGKGVVVATYSAATGAHRWSTAFAGTSPGQAWANTVVIANDGALLVSGAFVGDLVLGSTRLTSNGAFDIALARLDGSNGAPLAVRHIIAGPGINVMGLMREDPQGGVLLLTWVSNGADIGAGPITIQSTNHVPAMAHFDASLTTTQWTRVFDATDAVMDQMRFDPEGRIYVTGSFVGNLSFGSTQVTSAHVGAGAGILDGFDDGFLAALSNTGDLLWIETRTDPLAARDPYALAVGPDERIYVVEHLTTVPNWTEQAVVSAIQGP
jgi:hypothetical protein